MGRFFTGSPGASPPPLPPSDWDLIPGQSPDVEGEEKPWIQMINGVVDVGGELRSAMHQRWKLPSYCQKILEENLCEALLPMTFLCKGGETIVYYHFDRCLPLNDYLSQWKGTPQGLAGEVARILSHLTKALRKAEEWLLPLDFFSLEPETIFIHERTGDVKLAFCAESSDKKGLRERMGRLVKYLEVQCKDPRWSIYAGGIRRELTEKSLGLSEILCLFREKEREINMQQWQTSYIPEPEAFREMWEDEPAELKIKFPWRHKKK